MTSTLSLNPELPLAAGLEAAFGGVLAHAREQASRVEVEPAKALHAYRKSIRRARGLLKLTRGLLAPGLGKTLNRDLREVVRETSDLRDADMLLERLGAWPLRGEAREALLAAEAFLLEVQEEVQASGRCDRVLKEGAARLVLLAPRFRLPASLSWGQLRQALQESYRRTRHARKRALRKRGAEEIHTWRKRTKELRYQLELLRPHTRDPEPHLRLKALASELGELTDLTVLEAFFGTQAAALAPAPLEPVLSELQRAWRERVPEQLERPDALWDHEPEAFVGRILGPLVEEEAAAEG